MFIAFVTGIIIGVALTLFASKTPESPLIGDELGKIFLWDAHQKTGMGISTLTANEAFVKSGDFDKIYEIEEITSIAGYTYNLAKKKP